MEGEGRGATVQAFSHCRSATSGNEGPLSPQGRRPSGSLRARVPLAADAALFDQGETGGRRRQARRRNGQPATMRWNLQSGRGVQIII